MSFLHLTFNLSLSKSGDFYNKDHATVLHSCRTIRNLFQTDKNFKYQYSSVIDHCIEFEIANKITKTIDYLNEK
jgi:chromosomal replication initiation ATPase DnaA